ncbi:hypothetical protein HMPREF2946_05550 [Actinomyces sp. HMSC062G12]|nr:hypothetical protein HMPREF2946_05550 [Actinomyces sp. HMSC062G12]
MLACVGSGAGTGSGVGIGLGAGAGTGSGAGAGAGLGAGIGLGAGTRLDTGTRLGSDAGGVAGAGIGLGAGAGAGLGAGAGVGGGMGGVERREESGSADSRRAWTGRGTAAAEGRDGGAKATGAVEARGPPASLIRDAEGRRTCDGCAGRFAPLDDSSDFLARNT